MNSQLRQAKPKEMQSFGSGRLGRIASIAQRRECHVCRVAGDTV